MGRPPLPIGTYGKIRVRKLTEERFWAQTKYRDYDGVTRRVERSGKSKAAAERRLKEALRDRGKVTTAGEITPETLIGGLGELWLGEFEKAVADGKRSPTTLEQYRYRFESDVRKGIGRLRIREATVSRLDRLIRDVQTHHGTAAAKMARSVLSGMFGLAVRHDALDRNLVREVARMDGNRKSARSLELDQARDLRAKIHASEQANAWDLVDFTDIMLATGLRIGEAAAITWAVLDLEAGTVEVRGTVVRLKGVGLVLKPQPKSKSGYRTLELPTWAVAMLNRRRKTWQPNRWDVVFTAPLGGLRDPSNTQSDLREVFDDTGYPWVTSHVYRKTVATLMDEAGLSARAGADQLGHANVSMTQDRYFGRKVARTGAAGLLEAIDQPEWKSAGNGRGRAAKEKPPGR